jgi:hypothetical protein
LHIEQQILRKERHLSVWSRLAVVVALLVTLAGCGSDDPAATESARPSTRPTPTVTSTAPDRIGFPPRMPWWSAGELHVSDGTIPTQMRRIVSRGGTVIVGRSTQRGSHWMVLGELELVDLVRTRSAGVQPVLSANGRYAAWTTGTVLRRQGRFRADIVFTITAYDVGRSRVTGTTVLESRTSCCDGGGAIAVAGVDNDGSVVIGRYADRAWMWRPGSPPIRLAAPARTRSLSGNDQWQGGVSWTTSGDSGGPAVFARVSAIGVVTPVGRVPQTQGGMWSPHGTSYVYSPALSERQVRPIAWRENRRQVLQAPRGSWPLAWESDRRVLLVDGDLGRSIRLVRCWVGDGRCEQAGPLLRHAQVPDQNRF